MINCKTNNYRDNFNLRFFLLKFFFKNILFLVAISLPTYSDIYSWKDSNGKIHFGDKIIEGVEQKNVYLKIKNSEWKKYIIEVNDIDNILTVKERKRIEADVNAVYQFYDEKLYFDFYKTVPVKIRLYEKQESYNHYLSDRGFDNKKGSRGIYFPKTNEIVLYLNSIDRWRTFWTIKHEASHAIIHSLTSFIPAWLNEGIAENMESLGVRKKDLILYPHTENKRSINRAEKSKHRLDVEQLLSLSSRNYYENMKHGGNSHQAHAGELVRMLLSTEQGKSIIRRMTHIYKRGSRIYSYRIIEQHYIGGLATLQNNWSTWVLRASSKEIIL